MGAATALLRTRSVWNGAHVHPADIDDTLKAGALMTTSSGSDSSDGATRLPFAVDDVRLQGVSLGVWAVRCRIAPCLPVASVSH